MYFVNFYYCSPAKKNCADPNFFWVGDATARMLRLSLALSSVVDASRPREEGGITQAWTMGSEGASTPN